MTIDCDKMSTMNSVLFLLTASLLPSLTLAVEDSYPAAYVAYFSDDQCTNFAGLSGSNANETVSLVKATESIAPGIGFGGNAPISCVDAMACLLQPDSTNCQALSVSGETANVTRDVRGDKVYECDDSNAGVGQFDCSLILPTTCIQSSAYNCYFKLVTRGVLVNDPTSVIPSTDELDGLDQYAYVAYYEDEDMAKDECTNLAGIRGFVSDNDFTVPGQGVDDTHIMTCGAVMPCVLSPDGDVCQDEIALTGASANANVRVNASSVFECDDSNTAVNEPECSVIDPDDCRDSSIYTNCHFHWASGVVLLAQDSASVIAPVPAMTMAPSTAPSSMDTSDASRMFCGMNFLVAFVAVVVATA